ncbi:hypothetical protein AVBRAN9334_08800 [Campylobacter sp. RM9334]|uniref:hypothetical protein n=1 Tax=unclassified Campylobacter TaxID=2593542 RepID=UPI001BDAFFB4|nr:MULTISPECIES: hypothetical protein [unclassified Campylobacter]MBZ7976610.1 hypothetical protein [Campylobacter sp. RM12637]MBZ7978624.1 hypothetical protein [Campylobacter sp. RM12654]MBZ7984415.1 hypothetical protein [Campylobacter sp. RM12647]MBZ7993249.1 hypothetical protein [Campylobacter sp. RM9333]MBZ8008252.1 hypothetical protein [Campylobacter sp. RM9334]
MKHYINNTSNTPIMWQDNIAKKELSTQELASINASIKSNSFSVKTNRAQDYNTYFKFGNENIGVKLNEASIEKLKDFFDEDNFIKTNKGIILDKDAASYVAGWFSDIAYKQKFLESDIDNNGELTHKEARNTLSGFDEDAVLISDEKTKEKYIVSNSITKTYKKSDFLPKNDGYYSDISNSINDAIKDDKNLDGIITFGEFMDVGEKGYFEDFMSESGSSAPAISLDDLINGLTKHSRQLAEKAEEKLTEVIAKIKKLGVDKLDQSDKDVLIQLGIDPAPYESEFKLKQIISDKLNISPDKVESLASENKLDDFVNFSGNFAITLSETKLLDIKA